MIWRAYYAAHWSYFNPVAGFCGFFQSGGTNRLPPNGLFAIRARSPSLHWVQRLNLTEHTHCCLCYFSESSLCSQGLEGVVSLPNTFHISGVFIRCLQITPLWIICDAQSGFWGERRMLQGQRWFYLFGFLCFLQLTIKFSKRTLRESAMWQTVASPPVPGVYPGAVLHTSPPMRQPRNSKMLHKVTGTWYVPCNVPTRRVTSSTTERSCCSSCSSW